MNEFILFCTQFALSLLHNENISTYNDTRPDRFRQNAFAAALADRLDTEIISADSRQIYRGMDIGTGKDLADYTVNGKAIPYHLIDICDPGYKYNVFEYQHDFFRAYQAVQEKGKLPYPLRWNRHVYRSGIERIQAAGCSPKNPKLRESLQGKSLEELEKILAGYKVLHNKTDVDSAQRAIRAIEIEEYYKTEAPDANEYDPINSLIIGINIDRELRREKISRRLRARLEEGMVDEVKGIIASGVKPEDLIYYGLEYKYLTLYIIGELSYEEMVSQLEIAIHQFAKRQMTWFRGMERRGCTIHWIDATLPTEEKIRQTLELLEQNNI